MTSLEVARAVLASGCHVFRERKNTPGEYDAKPYDLTNSPYFTGSRRGWVILDAFTASAIVKVWEALNETNRAKFGALGIPKLTCPDALRLLGTVFLVPGATVESAARALEEHAAKCTKCRGTP